RQFHIGFLGRILGRLIDPRSIGLLVAVVNVRRWHRWTLTFGQRRSLIVLQIAKEGRHLSPICFFKNILLHYYLICIRKENLPAYRWLTSSQPNAIGNAANVRPIVIRLTRFV